MNRNGFRTMDRSGSHPGKSSGFTLIELLVAMVASLIAVSGMVLVMGNVIGTTNDTLKSTRLSGELRTGMAVVLRELRRANFNEAFAGCIGTGDTTCTLVPDTFSRVTTDGSECLAYAYRRLDSSGNWQTINGAMRLNSGVLQFNPSNATCTAMAGWNDITDGDFVQITNFDFVEAEGDSLLTHEQAVTTNLSQRVRKIRITITGRTCANGRLAGCSDWNSRTVQNTVRLRNDLMYATPTT